MINTIIVTDQSRETSKSWFAWRVPCIRLADVAGEKKNKNKTKTIAKKRDTASVHKVF